MSVVKELKEFMLRGNVVDMAVGVIVGGAFGKIVTSFVNDVIMPPIGVLLNGVDFKDLKLVIKEAIPASEGVDAVEAVTLNYGAFIQTTLDFVIVAVVIFFAIKGLNSLKRKKEEPAPAPAPDPAPSKEEALLTEIRDLLKNKN
ncbi:large-conductance mechanosensitive channel protein MscL [Dysgonomonas massiliensis]|uniref:large-conductance mechanosensitive channel protein MscL n=1 Tax=Dysgonomonas massiliensis TaxID=2040292 RepID=UPI000C76E7E8|nr:large-conductance mechanosensitive channel protein MscL [Dysgonomonas massiliensis]